MLNRQTITEEINTLSSLQDLIDAYKIVAATTMRRIRDSVLQNRVFYKGLGDLYQDVQRSYQKEMRKLSPIKKSGPASLPAVSRKHNGKTVLVLLSANTGLYGGIIYRTFSLFLQEAKKHPDYDLALIGKVGELFFKKIYPGRSYTYFDFSDLGIAISVLRSITSHLSGYERVVVFYGAFKNILVQRPSFVDVAAGGKNLSASEIKEGPVYLFEPSLQAVADFFETEIFASLLEQSFFESRLGKMASRFVSLDRASTNTETAFKNVRFERGKLRHRLFNQKQLNSLTGVALWSSR